MNEFVISKIDSSYLVTVTGRGVQITPLKHTNRFISAAAMADTLQSICSTKLVVYKPGDPFLFLKTYLAKTGWHIEEST